MRLIDFFFAITSQNPGNDYSDFGDSSAMGGSSQLDLQLEERSELNNQIDGVTYHNHRRGPERRKSRRMRSRRQRMRNFGGGLAGAQFNSQIQNNFFGDSKQVSPVFFQHWLSN